MLSTEQPRQKERKWLYPTVYVMLVLISMLPVYADKPFAPQDTHEVILNLLMVSVDPYKVFAPIFHVATIVVIVLIVILQERMSRVMAAYLGLNYLVIAFAATMGTTQKYGFVIHTGGLVTSVILGIAWITVAVRAELETSLTRSPSRHYLLLPLALLAFWAPYAPHGMGVRPDFNPLLFLVSPDYGLSFCFTTPVFLFLLILFYPNVNALAYRMTAFSGLLNGLVNLTHFFNPELRWMGVLHLPLLILSLYALILPAMARRETLHQQSDSV